MNTQISSAAILQRPGTAETRAILAAAMLNNGLKCIHAEIGELLQHRQLLTGDAMPVGSVEFMREAIKLAGITEPQNLSYPAGCERWLHRQVHVRQAGSILGAWFLKPVRTKAFSGFVFDTMQDPADLNEHDAAQHAAFMALPASDLVYASEPVKFVCEWRYYVLGGEIIGQARYDPDGAEDAPEPSLHEVRACIAAMGIEHPIAVDFGVLDTGETALVEVNDAWAIGLYKGALSNKQYLEFLSLRWQRLRCQQSYKQ